MTTHKLKSTETKGKVEGFLATPHFSHFPDAHLRNFGPQKGTKEHARKRAITNQDKSGGYDLER